jgi:hypothetical protein
MAPFPISREPVCLIKTVKYEESFIKALLVEAVAKARESDFVIPLSPTLIANMRSAITDKVIPVTHIILGSALLSKMVVDPSFSMLFDPTSRREDLLSGFLGVLLGMDVLTDAYFAPEERLLPKDFCAVIAITMAPTPAEEPIIRQLVSALVA